MKRATGLPGVTARRTEIVGETTRATAFLGIALMATLAVIGCGPAGDEGERPASETDGASTASSRAGSSTAGSSGPGASAFGFGQPVSEEDVARWDIDVGPDGRGLPPGSGTVAEGAVVYEASCARCHGPDAVDGPYGPLVATEGAETFPFGQDPSLTTSIGNYWPYATTVFDYVRRSMPFDDPGSLSDDEVYAVTAWLLWRNELISEDAVMDAETLPAVEMPGREHFVPSEDVSLTSLP